MDKSHPVCRECIAHHYWHHMDDRKRFVKVMMGDFRNGVIIPRKFAANIRGNICEEVKLEAPDGKIYIVQVAKEQNELILRAGWADFASAYELKLGDFLVFRNSENSHFKVRIFDPSGCEKELSCVLLDGAPCVQEKKVSHGNHMQSPTGKRMAIGNPSGSRKTSKMNPTDSPSQKKEGIQEPVNSGGFQKPTKSFFGLPTGFKMSSEQRAKVIALERKIQPAIPFYITAMHCTTVASGILAISKSYAMKHLTNKSGIIQLYQLGGSKIWTIKLDITTDGRCAVYTGWMDFIRDNKLREGDICIFQPSKSKNEVALIFHPLEESHKVKATESPSAEGLARHQTGECSNSRNASMMTPPDSPPQRSNIPYPEDTMNPMNSGDLQTSSKLRYVLAKGCSLTSAQKAKLDAFQKSIRPRIPLYVTNMNRANISDGYMIISKAYSDKYLPHEDQTITLCHPPGGKKRDANLKISTDGAYIFSAGWRSFVRDNKLQEGDACAFEASKSEGRVTVTVHPLEGSYKPPAASPPPLRQAIHPGYVVSRYTNLTPEQKKRVAKKLRQIQPETRVFLWIKRRGNEIMCIAKDFAMKHLPRASQTVRLRRPGMSFSWEVMLRVRNRGTVHHLCSGWKRFVDDSALQQGDLCLFQPLAGEDGGEVTMNVHILRGH